MCFFFLLHNYIHLGKSCKDKKNCVQPFDWLYVYIYWNYSTSWKVIQKKWTTLMAFLVQYLGFAQFSGSWKCSECDRAERLVNKHSGWQSAVSLCLLQLAPSCRTVRSATSSQPAWSSCWPSCATCFCPGWWGPSLSPPSPPHLLLLHTSTQLLTFVIFNIKLVSCQPAPSF